jgi:hypothetical protein
MLTSAEDLAIFKSVAASHGMETRFAWLPVRIGVGGWAWLEWVAYRIEPELHVRPSGHVYTVYRPIYYGGSRWTLKRIARR